MRFVIFTHSLVSDWNHGNAHFLRGFATELSVRGYEVRLFEPEHGWSRSNLVAEHGTAPIEEFARVYPNIRSREYRPETFDFDEALDGASVVLVHEWNSHEVVRRIGEWRAGRGRGAILLFHDTHHRSVTDEESVGAYDLRHYDGVLAYGGVIRDLYRKRGWARAAWTWHEAADTRVFRPHGGRPGRRPGLDRKLGRWRADAGDSRVPDSSRCGSWGSRRGCTACGIPIMPSLSWRSGNRVRRMAAELSRAGSLLAVPGDGTHPAAALYSCAAGNSDDTSVRGAGLRDPDDLGAMGGHRKLFRSGRDF